MPKLTLKDPGANYRSVAQIQDNNSLIEAAIENTISRDGTSPNQMEADLDLNSNKITNLGAPVNNTDAARKQDIDSGIGADVTTVATNITEIQTVSASIADVTAVAADLAGSDTIGDAAALLAVASPGLVAKNTSGTPVARTLTGGTGISVTNGDGGAGNPTITLDAELVDIAGITPSDGVFIIGDGSDFVGESGDTALGSLGGGATGISVFKGASESAIRTTLGLGSVSTLDVVDEDNMASDSDILVPTQQSVKAYVDSVAGAVSDISAITHADGVFIVSDGTGWVGESGATARTSMGVAIGTDVQAYNAGLQDISGLATTDGNIIVGDGANWVAESGATARTSLGLAIGTDVQAYDAGLASIAGLTTAADKMVYTTAIDTYAVTDLSSFARTVLDDATAKDARTTLEVNSKYVATISDLKALTGGDFEMVEVGGHTSANDGGGGLFIWDASDTTTDDNGIYIQPNAGGTGRWIRQISGNVINAAWYGVEATVASDQSSKIQAAIDYAESIFGSKVLLPAGRIRVDTGLTITESNVVLTGFGGDCNHDLSHDDVGTILAAYGSGITVLSVNSPSGASEYKRYGSGLSHVEIEGRNIAAVGLEIISVNSSVVQNVKITNCTSAQIQTNTRATFGEAADVQNAVWQNIDLRMGDGVASRSANGLVLTGAGSSGNFSWNQIQNLRIRHYDGIGIHCQSADNCRFSHVRIARPVGTGSGIVIDGRNPPTTVTDNLRFLHIVSTSPILVKGTADGFAENPPGMYFLLDQSNGSVTPTISAGVDCVYEYGDGYLTNMTHVGAAFGNSNSAASNAWANMGTASAFFANGAGNNVRLSGGDGTTNVYGLNVASSGGALRLQRLAGSADFEVDFPTTFTGAVTLDAASTFASATEVGDSTAASSQYLIVKAKSTQKSAVYFGDESASFIGGFLYDHPTNTLALRANGQSRVEVSSTACFPTTDSFIDLGKTGQRYATAYADDYEATTSYSVGGTQVVGSQGSAIASLTNSTGGTTDGTLAAISGTSADADLNNNFSELHTKLDAVLSALRTHGLIAT